MRNCHKLCSCCLALVGALATFSIAYAQSEASGTSITGLFIDVSKLCHDPVSNGDSWDYIWADDDNIYSFACDGRGYGKLARNLNFNKLSGIAWNHLSGSIVNSMDEYGKPGQQWPNHANWKITGGDCIDGVLYAFVENHWYGNQTAFGGKSRDPYIRQTVNNMSLIKSTDKGRTWMRDVMANYEHPMWRSRKFSTAVFCKYGQNGGATQQDDQDKYVYAISNDGYWNCGSNFYLGRALRSKLADLNAADWQYFSHGQWSGNLDDATPLAGFPNGQMKCTTGSPIWLAGIRKYVTVTWYDPGTTTQWHYPENVTFAFYQADHPWGPWSYIGEKACNDFLGDRKQRISRWYGPSLSPRFITANPDGSVTAILTFSGQLWDDKPDSLYKNNSCPITFYTTPQLQAVKTFNDTEAKYSGDWLHQPKRGYGDYQDDVHVTTKPGVYVDFAFTGRGIEVLSEKYHDMGDVEVLIDGVSRGTFSLYQDPMPRLYQVAFYRNMNLSAGAHTIRVVNKGPDAKFCLIDGFRVYDHHRTAEAALPERKNQAREAVLAPPTRTDECEFVGGVPLGGIGTGTFEVRGDGSLRQWQIFNNWGNTPSARLFKYAPSYDLLNAFAAVKIDGKAYMLEKHSPLGLPSAANVAYEGWFPFARLQYGLEPGTPIELSLEAFSPYVPHHANDSGIPAAGLTWRFKNTSARSVEIRLALSVVNPLGNDCHQASSGSLCVAESVRDGEGLALAALDSQPVSVIGGADNAETLRAFWDTFSSPNPKFANSGQGQRIAQVVSFSLQPHEERSQRFVVGWYFPTHKENGTGPFVGHRYEAWTASPVDSANLLARRFEALRAASARWRDTLRNASWPPWVSHWLCNNQYTLAKFTWWTKDERFMTYESPECPNGSPVHIIDLADWPVIDEFPELELRLLRQFAEHQSKEGRIPEEFNANQTIPSATLSGGRDLIDNNPKFAVEVYHRWRETGDRKFVDATWPAVKRAIRYCKRFDAMGVGLPSGHDISSTWDHWSDRYLFSYGGSVYLAGLLAAEELAKVQGERDFAAEMHALSVKGLTAMNAHLWNGEFYAMTTDKDMKHNDLSFVESTYGDCLSRFVGLGGILPDDRSLSSLRAIAKYNNQPTRWGLVVCATRSGKMVQYQGDVRAQITVCHALPAPIALIAQGGPADVENGLRILKQMYDLGEKHPGGLWNLPHHVVAASGERNVNDFGHYLRDRALWALLKVLNGWSYDAPHQSLAIGPVLAPENCRGPWICSKAYGTLAQEAVGTRQTVLLKVKDGELPLKELVLLSRVGTASSARVRKDGTAVCSTFVQKGDRLKISFAEAVATACDSTLEISVEGDRSFPVGPAAKEPISLQSLLREMADRDALARWPQPPYSSKEFSSYDRRSVSPDQPGWFANHDEGNFLRTEDHRGRKERVMMDADGPGAIVCFFKASTDPSATVRIYLDGGEAPVIEENLRYLLGGGIETQQERGFSERRVPPFPADEAQFLGEFGTIKPPLAGVQSLGCNLYLPIPYARHCKVTYDKPGRCYYRINYRTYPSGTPVETFTLSALKTARPVIEEVGQRLLNPVPRESSIENRRAAMQQTLKPGSSMALNLDGPAAVRSLAVRIDARNRAQAQRSTVLRIAFDGVETVWCPVGDFFASGIGVHRYHGWTNTVDGDGAMRCHWIMPFHKSCRVELVNLGEQPVQATLGDIGWGKWSWDRRSMYFHANWRQQYPILTKAGDGTMDWNYIETTGQGVYAGDTLVVHNGCGDWWGEGDEKIYVDGETFPSHFGTGTEDYYGYSRGGRDSIYFESPFISHPQIEGDKAIGYSTITRVRSLDAIPFSRRLKFDMEIWHWTATTMAYAATTYWYARPGATCNRSPDAKEAASTVLEEAHLTIPPQPPRH